MCKLTFWNVICFFIVSFLNAAHSDTQLPTDTNNDIIKIEVTGDEITGLNTLTNVRVVEKLKEGESVTSAVSKGKVGAVLTNRKLLGFNATNNAWTSFETFFNKDVFPNEIKVSSNMAVAIAKRRVYAYTATSIKWNFELVSFLEQILSSDISDNLIFVRTNARLLAFSFQKQTWLPQNLYAGETIKDIATGGNFATVTTNNRILTFDAKDDGWTEEKPRPDTEQQTTDLTLPSEGHTDGASGDKDTAPKDPDSKS
ncbi:MAG: hypothetical protein HYW14_00630 [Planctomycetes bacterium]|nr:hypothetical protein [Planctomycetota bacterium]